VPGQQPNSLFGQIELTPEGYNIAWANGTTWSFVRLGGASGAVSEFFINGSQPTYVTQNQNQLTFQNERGNISNGWVVNSNTVYAQGWNLFGTLYATPGGVEIAWANGTTWTEPRLGGVWNISNRFAQVYEGSLPGTPFFLTFINEAGNVSYGYLAFGTLNTAEVVAQNWGNLIGYVQQISGPFGSDLQIDWANGTRWSESSPV